MARRLLLIASLLVLAGNAARAEDLLMDAENFLAGDRLLLAAKRYGQVLVLEPAHPLAQLRLRQIFLIQRSYANYEYERARIEGDLFRNGSHLVKAGVMEPPEPGMSQAQTDGVRDAWTRYREARIVILKTGTREVEGAK